MIKSVGGVSVLAKHGLSCHCGAVGRYGYDLGCLDRINPYVLAAVPVNDGVNHPADRRPRTAA
jgi:hypothetical protein